MGKLIKLFKTVDELSKDSSSLVPAGNYALQIMKAEEKKSGSGESKLEVRYVIISDGAYKGQMPFPDSLSLQEKAQWKVANFLKATGCPGKVQEFDPDKLAGMKLICHIVQDDYQGSIRNKYDGYSTFDETSAKSLGAPEKAAEIKAPAPDDNSGW